jgi:hypothetical protein
VLPLNAVENHEYITREYVANKTPSAGKEKSFRARWGEVLTKKGMAPIANVFLDHYVKLGINAMEAMFLVHLMQYKWTVEAPYPSLKTIAKKMGKSEDTVRRIARSLEKREIIKRNYRIGQTNTYNLNNLIKKLEDFLMNTKVHRGTMQQEPAPSAPVQTKEEPLRRNTNNNSFMSFAEVLREIDSNKH